MKIDAICEICERKLEIVKDFRWHNKSLVVVRPCVNCVTSHEFAEWLDGDAQLRTDAASGGGMNIEELGRYIRFVGDTQHGNRSGMRPPAPKNTGAA